jgi:hypothetical protein
MVFKSMKGEKKRMRAEFLEDIRQGEAIVGGVFHMFYVSCPNCGEKNRFTHIRGENISPNTYRCDNCRERSVISKPFGPRMFHVVNDVATNTVLLSPPGFCRPVMRTPRNKSVYAAVLEWLDQECRDKFFDVEGGDHPADGEPR